MSEAPPGGAETVAALARTAFWFLRHGETAWNALNLSQGRVENPLNEMERGHAQFIRYLITVGRITEKLETDED